MTQQKANAQQEQHVIASPNPTADEGKTPAGAEPGKVSSARIQPAQSAADAPAKTTAKPRPKRRRTRPRTP